MDQLMGDGGLKRKTAMAAETEEAETSRANKRKTPRANDRGVTIPHYMELWIHLSNTQYVTNAVIPTFHKPQSASNVITKTN